MLLGDNQINTVRPNYGLSGLHIRVRLGMHCKVEKIGVDPMSISSLVQMNCVPLIYHRFISLLLTEKEGDDCVLVLGVERGSGREGSALYSGEPTLVPRNLG